MKRALPILLLGLLLTGCDPIYGVRRRASVPFVPEPAKVGAIIHATPGVDKVDYHYCEGSRPLTITGVKPPDRIYTFWYEGGPNVTGAPQFIEDYKGRIEYSQSLMCMGYRPTQASLNATLPVMKQIEAELEKECGLTNLQATVVQHCIRVKCD